MASAPVSMGEPPDREDMQGPVTGIAGPPSNPSPMPAPQDQTRGFVGTVKQIHTMIEDTARQFPAGANEFRKAQDALKEAMIKVINEQQKQQPQGQTMGAAA
jgi:hypothetical protein